MKRHDGSVGGWYGLGGIKDRFFCSSVRLIPNRFLYQQLMRRTDLTRTGFYPHKRRAKEYRQKHPGSQVGTRHTWMTLIGFMQQWLCVLVTNFCHAKPTGTTIDPSSLPIAL
jgi:hypothetical protein